MHIIVYPAGDIEPIAVRRKRQATEGIRHLQHLRLPKAAMRQIEHEYILVRIGRNPYPLIVVEPVIAAGQN